MTDTARRPVVDFDHHSEAFNADPGAAWGKLREQCPVAWSEHHGGFWIIADYEGNHDVLKNTAVFTTERVTPNSGLNIPSVQVDSELAYPEELDPPNHGPVRRLLNAIMSPTASKALQPRIEHWTTTCIDSIIEAGEGDLLYDVTGPVPAFTTLEWLGFPLDRVIEAAEIMHDTLGYAPHTERWQRAMEKRGVIDGILRQAIAERRKEPRDDAISWLMTQEVNGEPVDDLTIVRLGIVLVGGGVDTTTSLTSSALVHLQKDRALRQRLLDEPGLLEPATEEFLRYYPPLASIARTARQDIDYRGCPIRNGDRILVSRHAANYDPTAFERPEEFIVDRFPNRHVSFGLGPHRCPGSHLARLIFHEVMTQVLTRMPDYELDLDRVEPYPDRGLVQGWAALPARFTPGPRMGGTS